MSAQRETWVCFFCRYGVMHPKGTRTAPKCPYCGRDCENLEAEVDIPARNSFAEWRRLEDEFRSTHGEKPTKAPDESVPTRQSLQALIRELEKTPQSPDRDSQIASLKSQMNSLLD